MAVKSSKVYHLKVTAAVVYDNAMRVKDTVLLNVPAGLAKNILHRERAVLATAEDVKAAREALGDELFDDDEDEDFDDEPEPEKPALPVKAPAKPAGKAG